MSNQDEEKGRKPKWPKKVKLIEEHTHEGVPRKPGDEIEVHEADYNFLLEQKKINP